MFWLWLLFQGTRSDERARYQEAKYLSTLSLPERRAYVENQREQQRKAQALEDMICWILGGALVLGTLMWIVPYIIEVHKAL